MQGLNLLHIARRNIPIDRISQLVLSVIIH